MNSTSTLASPARQNEPASHGPAPALHMDVRRIPAALLDGALQLGIRGLLWLVERAEAEPVQVRARQR